ncbi:MAG: O-methyltransferase [Eubacteriales bacterium]|nr:O-methyltransferase [Eubacteriales bacterium]
MMDQQRITDYIHSLDRGHGELCGRIAREARAAHVPILRPETAALLQTVTATVRPMRILEVGTAVGYSALLMAQVMPEGAHITTIEKYTPRIPKARENFRLAGMEKAITLVEGDADEVLEQLSGTFDFIFMDAAKGQYIHWLPRIMALLSEGGLLMTDNVLQDGDIVESRFAVERRNRTIHGRMREYLYTLTHMDELQTSILPVGDGVALSVKIQRREP